MIKIFLVSTVSSCLTLFISVSGARYRFGYLHHPRCAGAEHTYAYDIDDGNIVGSYHDTGSHHGVLATIPE